MTGAPSSAPPLGQGDETHRNRANPNGRAAGWLAPLATHFPRRREARDSVPPGDYLGVLPARRSVGRQLLNGPLAGSSGPNSRETHANSVKRGFGRSELEACGFAGRTGAFAGDRISLHTREVAGSKPAVPMRITCKTAISARFNAGISRGSLWLGRARKAGGSERKQTLVRLHQKPSGRPPSDLLFVSGGLLVRPR